ncbi:hypothetical protein SAMN05421779_10145 [Insolitispirillum peregrinum]|uniref:Uncharacterized protein n=2 Tax=Insolitispirillum peregrinum TaxID=80876 RepID=A0A1N7IHN8_9PROT|nr:hypothetical protein SAMN05421779_10145 [Insolitispirillum peregrinum]
MDGIDRTMKWITLKTVSLAVVVCCLTFLGWYNWYIRHTFSEILPTGWYGGDYLPPPWRADFEQAFQSEVSRFYDVMQRSGPDPTFVKINGKIYARNYYHFFGNNQQYQIYQAAAACVVAAEVNRSVGLPAPPVDVCIQYDYGDLLDELVTKYCPADRLCVYKTNDDFWMYRRSIKFYDNEDYVRWFWFGVEDEYSGKYTWVGRLFSLFPDVDPESPFGDFIRSME